MTRESAGMATLPKTANDPIGFIKSGLICLPMMIFSALLILKGKAASNSTQFAAAILTYILANATFFLMIYTGKTNPHRSRYFILASGLFVVSFIANLIEIRGTMELSAANTLDGETPFCPLVIPMLMIPAALTNTIIFPGSFFSARAGIAPVLVLWLGFSLAIGRGWCSWACFFGGMDEGFSRLCRKPKISTISSTWTYLPWAILLTIVLTSALTLAPTYCGWLCPFKTVTEFPAINSVKRVLQAIIFVSLFIGFVIVLPLLSGRRTQCGLFCPFGAFQSLFNRLNVFEVRVDSRRCIQCHMCVKKCPTFSIDEENLSKGKAGLSCTKCGQCIDLCPRNAIQFHIKGTPLNVNLRTARILFLYPAFIFAAAIGGNCIYGGLERILRLMLTGNMIH